MTIKDPDRDRHHSTELGLTKKALDALIEEVAMARGMTSYDVRYGGKQREFVSARRAVCLLACDIFMLNYSGFSQISWVGLSEHLGHARSTLHYAAKNWSSQEGSQDGKAEEALREAKHLLPAEESIHDMARRVCKRGMRNMPDGKRKELGYWSSHTGVNHG